MALVGAGISVVLMGVRAFHAISFAEPLQLATSGAEYESLYAIWKYIHGLTVYADHTKIPFAGSFYNWLYYVFYGEITRLILAALSLGDVWLPTVTRLVTLGGAVYGAWISSRIFMSLADSRDRDMRRLGLAFAILVFFGPLMGFFGMSTQPDIWGFALDVTAVYFFLRFYDTQPAVAVLLFWAFAYLAWGFKQVFVFSTGAVGLFLLLRRDWRALMILIAFSILGWSVTLAFGSSQYVTNVLFFGGVSVVLDGARFLRNVGNAAIKILPILLGIAGVATTIAVDPATRRKVTEAAASAALGAPGCMVRFAALGVVATGALMLPASAKLGASENYYFMLSFYLALLLIATLRCVAAAGKWPAHPIFALSFGWILHTAAVIMVLAGITGTLTPMLTHAKMTSLRNCLIGKNLARPFFIAHPYLSLPWMIPADQHFVIHGNYNWDRQRGAELEGGGIGGLIDRGYFATIAVPGVPYDNSALLRYQLRDESCDDFKIYDRVDGHSQ